MGARKGDGIEGAQTPAVYLWHLRRLAENGLKLLHLEVWRGAGPAGGPGAGKAWGAEAGGGPGKQPSLAGLGAQPWAKEGDSPAGGQRAVSPGLSSDGRSLWEIR